MTRTVTTATACLTLTLACAATFAVIAGARSVDRGHRVAACLAQGVAPDHCAGIRAAF